MSINPQPNAPGAAETLDQRRQESVGSLYFQDSLHVEQAKRYARSLAPKNPANRIIFDLQALNVKTRLLSHGSKPIGRYAIGGFHALRRSFANGSVSEFLLPRRPVQCVHHQVNAAVAAGAVFVFGHTTVLRCVGAQTKRKPVALRQYGLEFRCIESEEEVGLHGYAMRKNIKPAVAVRPPKEISLGVLAREQHPNQTMVRIQRPVRVGWVQ